MMTTAALFSLIAGKSYRWHSTLSHVVVVTRSNAPIDKPAKVNSPSTYSGEAVKLSSFPSKHRVCMALLE
jgi:hypothetical protein